MTLGEFYRAVLDGDEGGVTAQDVHRGASCFVLRSRRQVIEQNKFGARCILGRVTVAQTAHHQLGLHSVCRGFHQWHGVTINSLLTTGDVDNTNDCFGLGVVHGDGRAAPCVHKTIEVFIPANLDGVIQSECCSGSGSSRNGFTPVRTFDKHHGLCLGLESLVALNPQQPAHSVADSNEHAGIVVCIADKELANDRHHLSQGVGLAVVVEL